MYQWVPWWGAFLMPGVRHRSRARALIRGITHLFCTDLSMCAVTYFPSDTFRSASQLWWNDVWLHNFPHLFWCKFLHARLNSKNCHQEYQRRFLTSVCAVHSLNALSLYYAGYFRYSPSQCQSLSNVLGKVKSLELSYIFTKPVKLIPVFLLPSSCC